MDTGAPTPRVNGELLGRFVGRRVLLVGRKQAVAGAVLELLTSDKRTVGVTLVSAPPTSDFVEFECVVQVRRGGSHDAAPACGPPLTSPGPTQSPGAVTEVARTCWSAFGARVARNVGPLAPA